jgi:hypothetical protein
MYSSIRGLILIGLISLCSCVNLGNPNGIGPHGWLYSDYKITTYAESGEKLFQQKIYNSCITKKGPFWMSGDLSLEKMIAQHSLKKIYSIERKVVSYSFLYTEICIKVNGETF